MRSTRCRTGAAVICAWGTAAFVAACGESGPAPLAMAEIQFLVPLDDPAGPTGRLVGWNVGRGTLYATADDDVHRSWRTPERAAAFARLEEIRSATGEPPYVRFSGLQIDGALGGDGYHFWDYADPAREIADDDNMAPYQTMTIVEEVGATPLVTVNFGSGTADEARRYVDHLVGTGESAEVQARAHWGHADPWPVSTYEIGNEVYGAWNTGNRDTGRYAYANPDAEHGGDPDWHGRPANDPADYAARALEYLDAIATVQPQARAWVPLSQASMDGWGGLDTALGGLDPLLRDERVEAVVVHHYQVDDAATMGALDMAAPEPALAGSELLRPGYVDLRERLSTISRTTPLQIAITEYHVAGAFTFGAFDDNADTALAGLGVADAMLLFADLGVEHAAQHMAIAFGDEAASELLFEPWYNPLRVVEGEVVPRPSFVATAMIADHLRAQTVRLEPVAMIDGQWIDGTVDVGYPLVRAVAFVDDVSATIVGLHRDLAASHQVGFDLPGDGWRVEAARVYAPAELTTPVGAAPIETDELPFQQVGARVVADMPPHSLFAFTLTRT